MYIPKNMLMTDSQAIEALLTEESFALLISSSLEATHLPLIYQPVKDGKGLLYGHFAKANGHWRDLDGQRVLAIFSGPHAYISPTWYANKPAVPTWNYAAIHCYGTVTLLNDEDTLQLMDNMVEHYEPNSLADSALMPLEYKAKLAKAVVGFRIDIDDIQAKEKLGQHKSVEDQASVFKALSTQSHHQAKSLVDYMTKRKLGTGQ